MTNIHQAQLAHTHTIHVQQGYLFVSYIRMNSQTVQKKNHNSYTNNAHTYKHIQLHTLDHVNISQERHIQQTKTSSCILLKFLKKLCLIVVILNYMGYVWDVIMLTYLFFVSIGFCYVSSNRYYIVMFSRKQLISLPLYFILWKMIYHHIDEVRTLLFFFQKFKTPSYLNIKRVCICILDACK